MARFPLQALGFPEIHGDNGPIWWGGLPRAASSPGSIWALLKALRDTDVRPLLPRVSVPTLVLHRRNDRAVRMAAGRDQGLRPRRSSSPWRVPFAGAG